ncbi:NAD-dependent epimerase/dehydratase family protein [Frankia sp. CNm7]|uniref:NAD-dependent epimerase/dehydratase family protein n=1 Tax=Frankia nepalensis TaxID=1836974 RepID=A0A937RNT2_9ACTN|nr:NAD-dependent epimerase/dehydratase family protein [Frankia nepalensis]MBL7495166.1 NAD-dependent epimerase/dehydratase family protein [Frankia nepalensis]MBL7514214.1 NAD-dependent epimerase/dehydratase family protein [Frankia nepalensis]MBL7522831.1 NAD-dependent epimerase/dehydratase family protein [Frankia nepalensis]MBL7629873.1 NAD-dependent epimerase/dehydratase family protein [Frankia nepalensis]
MKIFLTGATGVLGRRVVPSLVAAGHAVDAVARGEAKADELRRAGADPVAVDLFDRQAVFAAVTAARPDAVVHLATNIPNMSRALLPGAWRINDRLRAEASHHLADAALAAGAGHYLQESITFGYADGADRWLDEDAPLARGPQERAVAASAQAVARFAGKGGAGVLLRFAAFYAADSAHTQAQVAMARAGRPALPGPADGYLSSIQIDDAASAVVAALTVPAGTYNVADDAPMLHRDAADLLAAVATGRPGTHGRLIPAAVMRLSGRARPLTRSHRISNARFRDATGWRPRFPSLADGLPEVVRELGAATAAGEPLAARR